MQKVKCAGVHFVLGVHFAWAVDFFAESSHNIVNNIMKTSYN